jgi:cellulose synthase/poly-beta-1,6-N-acetylglucosamine synthase-like glycosyltransferase
MTLLRVSVVVPTYRRPALLDRCIGALARQSLPAAEYEIIVADDAGSIETREQCARWTDRAAVAVRCVAAKGVRRGPAAARNVGWRAALAPVIAFTDDDTVPSPDWLAQGSKLFADPGVDAAWGRVVVPLPDCPTDYELDAAGLERAGFVTANCFVRARLLESLGGFDEEFRSAWREDSDLFFRLIGAGYSVIHAPSAVVVHPVRRGKWGESLRQQKKSAYDALLYKKHPGLYAKFVRPGRPRLYYLAVAMLLGITIGALTGRPFVAACCAAGWLAVTLQFTLRRLRGTSQSLSHRGEMLLTSALIPPLSLYWRARGALRHRVLFW